MLFYIKVSNKDYGKVLKNSECLRWWVIQNLESYKPLYVGDVRLDVKQCLRNTYIKFWIKGLEDIPYEKIKKIKEVIDKDFTELLLDCTRKFKGLRNFECWWGFSSKYNTPTSKCKIK